MKKFLLLTMLFFAAIVFVGCGKETTTQQTTGSTTGNTTAVTTDNPTTVAPTDTDPVILGADDVTIEKNSTFVPLAGVTASDAEDGDLTSRISYSGNVNPRAEGTYTATYTVVDNDGNITTVTRTVTVEFNDSQAPLIVGAGDTTIYVGEVFEPLTGVSATDTVDGTVAVTSTGSVDIWTEGVYPLEYQAEDAAGNEATADRDVTVSYGDFVFGDATDYILSETTTTEGVLSTPLFSGGVINDTIANFTYVKVEVTLTTSEAGTLNVALGEARGSLTSFAATGEADDTFEVIYVITETLTDATFDITLNSLTISDLTVSVSFGQVRDMIAPVLTVPTPEIGYVVGYSQADLEAVLLNRVTAVDNIDGNITSSILIDYGTLDLNTVGIYDVVYSVSDEEGNESTFTRSVIIGNSVDSGYISDPTFQNNGDGQWIEKETDGGNVTVVYDNVAETMAITVNGAGIYPSAAGVYFKQDSTVLETNQWYMLTFTVKSSWARNMEIRYGLVTDQGHGWVDDADGRSEIILGLTEEYQTFNFYFKLDTLTSTAGYEEFIIELNLGAKNYDTSGEDGTTTFKAVSIQKIVTAYEPPTFEENTSADLPRKFTVDDAAKTWADYVTFYNMSGTPLTATVDASAVNMGVAGSYDILFSATDEHDLTTTHTLTIQVLTAENADTVGPVVSVKTGVVTTVEQFTQLPVNLNELVEATDAVDGEIMVLPSMVDDGNLDLDTVGVYTLTVTVYDLSGNVTVFTVDVTVTDKEAPTILVNDTDLAIGDGYTGLEKLVVNDNVDGVIDNANVTITGLDAFMEAGVVNMAGEFDVTYVVTDTAGNQASKTVKVFVSDIEWDEATRVSLGAPDQGPTHSTVLYNETEEAQIISDIDISGGIWDLPRWTYLLDDSDLTAGNTYKFEITVKADTATQLQFRIGSALYVDPWIDNFTGGLRTVNISDTYETYQVIFTVDKAMPAGVKFEFTYGFLDTDTTNNIYIKAFDLVEEKLPEYVSIMDLYSPDEIAHSTVTPNLSEGALVISDMETASISWDSGRLVYYVDNALLEANQTYRIVFTAKADTATDLKLRIGGIIDYDPWIDNFTGGLKTINITTEYTTYEFIFTADKDISGGIKFQFMYGYLDTDAGNSMMIKDFHLQQRGPIYADVQDLYTYDESAESTVVISEEGDSLLISDMTYAPYEWSPTGRLVYYIDDSTFVNGQTYRIVFTVKADVATDIKLRIGSTLYYDPWIDDFTGGVKTVHISTEFETFEIVFTADKAMPFGNAKFQFMYGYLSTDAGNAMVVKDFYLQEVVGDYEPTVITVDDFSYVDEADFATEWTERTSGVNTAADLSDKLDLESDFDAMIITLPDTPEGWLIARAYDSLSSFGATDSENYLAFYVTNNTNTTTAKVWLYWAGSQNAYDITLPAIGESGWAYLDVTDSGHQVSEITDFGIAFDNQTWSIYTGKLIVYQIALVGTPLDLLNVDQNVVIFNAFENYADDADYQAVVDDNIEGNRIGSGAYVKSNTVLEARIDGTYYVMQDAAYGVNGIKIRVTKAEIPAGMEYIAIWVKASDVTGMNNFQAFTYDASYQDISSLLITDFNELANGTFVYIPVSALKDTTNMVSLVVNCGGTVVGDLYFDNILFVKEANSVVYQEPVNQAPVVSVSDANLAILSGMTLEAGDSIEALVPTLVGMIDINDDYDGVIAAEASMIELNGLDLANPAMGMYTLTITATDSEGLTSNVYELELSIVTVLEDFEGFTDDADLKANWSMLVGFRKSGGAWLPENGALETTVDGNVLVSEFASSTNGIKLNVTKAALEAMGAEYVGIFVKTSAELTGNSVLQAFAYDSSFASLTIYGNVNFTDEGTYVYVKVSDLKDSTTSVSFLINAAAGNEGELTLDNIVIK